MAANTFGNDVLAEETHSGQGWSFVMLAALIGPLLGVTLAPAPGFRGVLIVVGLIGVGVAAVAWSGFQYRFLPGGVEIRTMGMKLRTIPKQAIVSYSIEPWAFIRGCGIRGIGGTRAYVWGNKVVHVKTSEGEVFLGHSDPARIVHDLDLVMGFVTPR